MPSQKEPSHAAFEQAHGHALGGAAETYPVDGRGYCDTPGASEYTQLSPSYLNKARHFGTGPEWVTFGRAVRYSYAALDAWAARQRRTSTRGDEVT